MPARKPASLRTRHDTIEEKATRADAEAAMQPKTKLTMTPPARLRGHKTATETWKKLIGLYNETEGTIITAFDELLLTDFCLEVEELQVGKVIQEGVLSDYKKVKARTDKMKLGAHNFEEYASLLEQQSALLARWQGLDARNDGKRKLIFSKAQSLYLTPRARAGVAPAEKPPKEADDPMDTLLG